MHESLRWFRASVQESAPHQAMCDGALRVVTRAYLQRQAAPPVSFIFEDAPWRLDAPGRKKLRDCSRRHVHTRNLINALRIVARPKPVSSL